MAELTGCHGEPLIKQPCLISLVRAPRRGEVPRGEDQGPCSEHASAKRQQPTPCGVSCRLQQRSLGCADVMARKPVHRRHEQRPCDRQRQYGRGDPGRKPSDVPLPSSPALRHKQTLVPRQAT